MADGEVVAKVARNTGVGPHLHWRQTLSTKAMRGILFLNPICLALGNKDLDYLYDNLAEL